MGGCSITLGSLAELAHIGRSCRIRRGTKNNIWFDDLINAHLFQGFKADRRVSMDIYAERLFGELQKMPLDARLFRPSSGVERYADSRFVMRYLRYLDYPRQVRQYCATDVDVEDVVHVLDHGYAHLLGSVQSNSRSSSLSSGPKTCITVHDLIPILAWRGRFGHEHVGRRPRLALHSAKYLSSATKLFADSSNTANDLHAEFDIPMNRIEVVPAPLDAGFVRSTELEISEFRKNNDISSEYFWILVSGNEFYKNHSVIVSTFNKLKSEGLPVKILKTGMKSVPVSSPLSTLDAQNVKCVSVDSTQLSTLYSSVDCLLFPSIYEGFGYPVVEALACSTPVICSQAASLPEVGGELAMYYASDDSIGMAAAIRQLLRGEIDQDLAVKGPGWVEQFRAPHVAKQLFEHYQEL